MTPVEGEQAICYLCQRNLEDGCYKDEESPGTAAMHSGPPRYVLILVRFPALTCDCCPATQAILLQRCLAAGSAGSLRGRPAPHTRPTAASRQDSCEGNASLDISGALEIGTLALYSSGVSSTARTLQIVGCQVSANVATRRSRNTYDNIRTCGLLAEEGS